MGALAIAGAVIGGLALLVGIYQSYQSSQAKPTAGSVASEQEAYGRIKNLMDSMCGHPRSRLRIKYNSRLNSYDAYSHLITDLPDRKVPGQRVMVRLIPAGDGLKWRVQSMKWSWDTFEQTYKGKSIYQVRENNYNNSQFDPVEYRNCWFKYQDELMTSTEVLNNLRQMGVAM